jgi:hypothetical protein
MQNYTDSQLDFLKTFAYSLSLANVVPFGAHQYGGALLQNYAVFKGITFHQIVASRTTSIHTIQRLGFRT